MVAAEVRSGTPSQEGDGVPTSSTSPSAASRSKTCCGINMARPGRETDAVQLRPTCCGGGASSNWSTKNGKWNIPDADSYSATKQFSAYKTLLSDWWIR